MDIRRLGTGFRRPKETPPHNAVLNRRSPAASGLSAWFSPVKAGNRLGSSTSHLKLREGVITSSTSTTNGGQDFLPSPSIRRSVNTNQFSCAIVCLLDAVPVAYSNVIGQPYRGDGTWTLPYYTWKFGTDTPASNLKATFSVVKQSDETFNGYISTANSYWVVNDGLFHTYLVTLDGTSVRFYRDGVLFESGTMPDSLNFAQIDDTRFGTRVTVLNRDLSTAGEGWSGDFFGAAIWNKCLSAREATLFSKPEIYLWDFLRSPYV